MTPVELIESLTDEQIAALLEALETDESTAQLYKLIERAMDDRGL